MKLATTHLVPFAIAAALTAGSHAATIVWGTATTISGDLDVSTTGSFVYAEHWGGTDNTVNGVAFSAAQNNVVASGTVNTYTVAPPPSLSAAYSDILKGIWYNAGAGTTVTLNNLTVTQEYQIQIWAVDKRYSVSQFQNISGGPSLSIGTGQYAIGTFTADAATQVITMDVGSDGIVNAIQVRAIPEPGSALLGGIGMLALLRRRR